MIFKALQALKLLVAFTMSVSQEAALAFTVFSSGKSIEHLAKELSILLTECPKDGTENRMRCIYCQQIHLVF